MKLVSPLTEQLVSRLKVLAKEEPTFNESESERVQSFLLKYINDDKIVEALTIAVYAHANQRRKFTNEPYVIHSLDVAETVANLPEATSSMICASLLHDVIEDTPVKPQELEDIFNKQVMDYLHDLTWQPDMKENRKTRQEKLYKKLKTLKKDSKTIKLADILSNSQNLGSDQIDDKFAKLYLPEQYAKIQALKGGNKRLHLEAQTLIKNTAEKRNISLVLSGFKKSERHQNKLKIS